MKKSWREKLADDKGLPKVGEVTGKLTQRWGKGRFVIPAPREVEALMRQVPKGRLVTLNELRAALARKHQTDLPARSRPEYFRGLPRTPPPRRKPPASDASPRIGAR